jgi:hypothetical protein
MPSCNSVKAAPFVFLGPISYRCHPRDLRFRQKNPNFPRYIWPDFLQYLHAVHRGRRNARRISAGLSSVARLCPHASRICDCVLQFRQRRNSGYCIRKDARGPLFGPLAIDVSETKQSIRGSTIPLAIRPAFCSASALVAVKLKAFSNSHDWCWPFWVRVRDRQDRL